MSTDIDRPTARFSGVEYDRSDDTLTMRAALSLLLRSRWWIASLTVVGAVVSIGVVLLWPRQYVATVLLYPVTNQSSSALGALGGLASQFGGIASLAGLNLTDSAGARAEAIATLQSEALTRQYVSAANLLPVLFSRDWDPARQRWITTDPDDTPSLWKANQYFAREIRSVVDNPRTGLVAMTITWKDPELAATWANDLVRLTNDYLRDKAINQAASNIRYLNEQAAKTNVVEVRQALYTLMESEIKKEMIARGSKEYALRVVDPATAPERATYPRSLLWTAGGTVLGFVLGLFVAAVRTFFSPAPTER